MIRLALVLGVLIIGGASKAFHFGDHANDGKVVFGIGLTQDKDIQHVQSVFGPGDQMVWIAHFGSAAGTTNLFRIVAPASGLTSANSYFDIGVVSYSDPGVTDGIGQRAVSDWARYGITVPGTYVMSYYRNDSLVASYTTAKETGSQDVADRTYAALQKDGTLLAQGTFTLK